MDRIRARLKNTSQSWIASIVQVLNLVSLAGTAPLFLDFSAWKGLKDRMFQAIERIKTKSRSRFNSGLVLNYRNA